MSTPPHHTTCPRKQDVHFGLYQPALPDSNTLQLTPTLDAKSRMEHPHTKNPNPETSTSARLKSNPNPLGSRDSASERAHVDETTQDRRQAASAPSLRHRLPVNTLLSTQAAVAADMLTHKATTILADASTAERQAVDGWVPFPAPRHDQSLLGWHIWVSRTPSFLPWSTWDGSWHRCRPAASLAHRPPARWESRRAPSPDRVISGVSGVRVRTRPWIKIISARRTGHLH